MSTIRSLGLLIIVIFFACYSNAASPLEPVQLTTEYLRNPLAIDVQKPRFSWKLTSQQRDQRQSAYEIIISNNLDEVQQLNGTNWKSGKVASSQNVNVEYSGAPLNSFTRYHWRVRVYDAAGNASEWSAPAFFETGILDASDWKASWIGDGRKQFEKEEEFYQNDQMPLFRKEFATNKKVESARLYISGLGYYEAFLNGQKIGDHVLDPGFTTFKEEVLYVTYDVTQQIRSGNNVIGVMLGNGWYNPLPIRLFGKFDLRRVQQTGRPCVKAQMLIRYTDGSSNWVTTDESWKTALGPIVRNNVYLGEHYDARLEKAGWNTINYTSTGWKNAVKVEGPSGELRAQMLPPIRITKGVTPLTIKEVGRDTFIVDMGQNFAGVVRIKVKGPAGKRIALRYGEDVFENGRLNYLTTVAGHIKEMWNLKGGPGAPKTAWQEDVYLLKGVGVETWSPRFTFHGFRYVEITGWPGKPTLSDIEGLRMNTDLQESGSFACSNEMFNNVNEVTKWTFLSNVFSVQSDCPGREKMGYGADIVVTTEAFMYNYDMAQFYRKTVRDFANEQQPDGGITEIAPYTGIADRGYGGESGPLGWQLAFPYVQKKLYEFYGDKQIIETNYAGLKKQMDFLQEKQIGGLFHWDISDHESLDPRPEAFSAAAFFYHHAKLASEFATILDKKEDADKYAKLSDRIKNLIARKYLVPNTGRFDIATQAAQLFALWYNLSPERDKSIQVLLDEYARHNWHVSTGIFGTKFLFDFFRETDQNELAYKIANQRDYPGWGYMLANGATTLWESWKKPDQNSQNHPMFGSISEWFYRSLLGINPAAPGFEKILIKPQPAGDLTWAQGTYESVRGTIASDWKKEGNNFILNISVPANATAEVWVLSKEGASVNESGKQVDRGEVKLLRREKGYAVLAVPSGDYSFTSEWK
jgi:alpha-L-rhamnosidase